jgi:hypothetical protein
MRRGETFEDCGGRWDAVFPEILCHSRVKMNLLMFVRSRRLVVPRICAETMQPAESCEWLVEIVFQKRGNLLSTSPHLI